MLKHACVCADFTHWNEISFTPLKRSQNRGFLTQSQIRSESGPEPQNVTVRSRIWARPVPDLHNNYLRFAPPRRVCTECSTFLQIRLGSGPAPIWICRTDSVRFWAVGKKEAGTEVENGPGPDVALGPDRTRRGGILLSGLPLRYL